MSLIEKAAKRLEELRRAGVDTPSDHGGVAGDEVCHGGADEQSFGGAGGEGIFMKRAGLSWSAPVAVNTGSASIGLQAGGQSRDIIIVMNTDNEVSNFLDSGLYGLAEASAVAGPAKTDPYNAGGPVPATYYYIRSKGLFGGLLLGGVHFSISDKVNHETYGDSATIGDILRDKYPAPAGASVLWQSLN